ncbi:carbonic anhydrase protein [Rutstroemia sp. NJR-2017a BBW]|nr:carbonic anhydrase protein [Rutstroemia sp. NJR-2017a BBW]
MSTRSEEKIASILEQTTQRLCTFLRRASEILSRTTKLLEEEALQLAAIIRNAGGHAVPAHATLLALDSIGGLGTIIVIHHTDCGMSTMSEKEFRDTAKAKHPEFDLPAGEVYGAIENPEETVRADVGYLKSFESWGKADVTIAGFVLDTDSGVLRRVA